MKNKGYLTGKVAISNEVGDYLKKNYHVGDCKNELGKPWVFDSVFCLPLSVLL